MCEPLLAGVELLRDDGLLLRLRRMHDPQLQLSGGRMHARRSRVHLGERHCPDLSVSHVRAELDRMHDLGDADGEWKCVPDLRRAL